MKNFKEFLKESASSRLLGHLKRIEDRKKPWPTPDFSKDSQKNIETEKNKDKEEKKDV